MKKAKHIVLILGLAALCTTASAQTFSPQQMADTLYDVIRAHRAAYTNLIVNRLDNQEGVIEANEHWEDEQALLLPAQMFRATAELVQKENAFGLSYSLLSLWPVNSKNNAKTETEKNGLKFVAENKGKNFYGEEVLDGKKYFTAVYPDLAVSKACIECHNKEIPKKDFKLRRCHHPAAAGWQQIAACFPATEDCSA